MQIKKKILIKNIKKDFAPGLPIKNKITPPSQKKNKTWEFVIQKHLTNRAGLHYDVRLGDPSTGIGHSFVVKIPPKKIGDKVLAVQTSDHRIPYFDFKGKIKSGYGAGKVSTHTRQKVKLHESSPKKVSFSLDDESKHTLINIGDKNWLFIKSKFKKEAENIETARPKVIEYLKKMRPHAYKMSIVGSISRNHPNVNDADIVVYPKKTFVENAKKITDISGGNKMLRTEYKGLPLNIWLTNKSSFEPTKYHFSRGKGIIQDKIKARQKGYKLTRYGLSKDNTIVETKEKKIKDILQNNNF